MAAKELLIGAAHQSVTDTVAAPPAEVRAFYVDLDNIAPAHPLVISVQTVGRTAQPAGGYVQEYRVRDRIPIGRFALHIRYAVRLSVPATGDVIAESRQFPGCVCTRRCPSTRPTTAPGSPNGCRSRHPGRCSR